MIRADVIYLVSTTPGKHGVFGPPSSETERMVYCTVRSVGRNEFYRAKEQGLEPQYVFELADYSDYAGERIVIFNGVRYDVIRTYVDGLKIEITVEEAKA